MTKNKDSTGGIIQGLECGIIVNFWMLKNYLYSMRIILQRWMWWTVENLNEASIYKWKGCAKRGLER